LLTWCPTVCGLHLDKAESNGHTLFMNRPCSCKPYRPSSIPAAAHTIQKQPIHRPAGHLYVQLPCTWHTHTSSDSPDGSCPPKAGLHAAGLFQTIEQLNVKDPNYRYLPEYTYQQRDRQAVFLFSPDSRLWWSSSTGVVEQNGKYKANPSTLLIENARKSRRQLSISM